MNFFVGAFYDGVYLLGIALNETLAEGGDIRDGISITRRMWDRDFIGVTGHVRIDDNGDRDADYSILDLDPITGRLLKIQTIRSARLYLRANTERHVANCEFTIEALDTLRFCLKLNKNSADFYIKKLRNVRIYRKIN